MTTIYISVIALSFLSSLVSFRLDYAFHLKIFSLLLGLTLITELLAVHGLHLLSLKSNLPIYNTFVLVEFWIYVWFFSRILRNKKILLLTKWFLILFPFLWLITIVFIFGINNWNSYIIITGSAFTVFLSVYYYYELFTSAELVTLTKKPEFWIATGLIIFYAGNLPFTGMLNYLASNYKELAIKLVTVLRVLIIVMYSLFIYAYLCPINIRKFL